MTRWEVGIGPGKLVSTSWHFMSAYGQDFISADIYRLDVYHTTWGRGSPHRWHRLQRVGCGDRPVERVAAGAGGLFATVSGPWQGGPL